MKEKSHNFLSNLLKRKDTAEIIESSSNKEIKKTLGLFDLVMIGVGAIFGAGIFLVAGIAVADTGMAGPSIIISLIISLVACVFTALCYCELATIIPVAGSAYIYTYATLGEFAAWLVGMFLFLEYIIGMISDAISWVSYLFQFLRGFEHVLPHWVTNPPVWLITDYNTLAKQGADVVASVPHVFGMPISVNLPAILYILLVVWCVAKGSKESTLVTTIIVFIKILVALAFVCTGLFYIRPENWQPFAPNGISGIFLSSFMIIFAYIGFDSIATVAEEAKNPKKDIPWAIILSLGICTIIYVSIALVLTGMMPMDKISLHAPVAYALQYVGQTKMAGFVSLGALAAITSVSLVMAIAGSRILYAISRDGFLPEYFKVINPKTGTPTRILWAIALIVILGIFTIDLRTSADLCVFGALFSLIIVCISIPILRKTEPNIPRTFKVPFSPYLIPILGVLTCLGLCVTSFISGAKSTPLFFVYMILGILFYFLYGYKKIRKIENSNKKDG